MGGWGHFSAHFSCFLGMLALMHEWEGELKLGGWWGRGPRSGVAALLGRASRARRQCCAPGQLIFPSSGTAHAHLFRPADIVYHARLGLMQLPKQLRAAGRQWRRSACLKLAAKEATARHWGPHRPHCLPHALLQCALPTTTFAAAPFQRAHQPPYQPPCPSLCPHPVQNLLGPVHKELLIHPLKLLPRHKPVPCAAGGRGSCPHQPACTCLPARCNRPA